MTTKTPESAGRDIAAHAMIEGWRGKVNSMDDIEVAVCAHVLQLSLGALESVTPYDPVAMCRAAANVFRRVAELVEETASEVESERKNADAIHGGAGSALLVGLGHPVDQSAPEAS